MLNTGFYKYLEHDSIRTGNRKTVKQGYFY